MNVKDKLTEIIGTFPQLSYLLTSDDWVNKLKSEFKYKPWFPVLGISKFNDNFDGSTVAFKLSKEEIFTANLFYCIHRFVKDDDNSFLKESADLGHPEACHELYLHHLKQRNYNEAKNWLIKGCRHDNTKCIYDLCKAYENGITDVIKKNVTKAYITCRLAMELGHQEAEFQYKVKTLLMCKFDRRKNFKEGIRMMCQIKNHNKFAKNLAMELKYIPDIYISDIYPNISADDIKFLRRILPLTLRESLIDKRIDKLELSKVKWLKQTVRQVIDESDTWQNNFRKLPGLIEIKIWELDDPQNPLDLIIANCLYYLGCGEYQDVPDNFRELAGKLGYPL